MHRIAALAVLAVVAMPAPVSAANARRPYSNVDRRVDLGNDTGDSQVDRLNQQQLDRGAPPYGGAPGAAPYGVPGPGGPIYSYLPPPGYRGRVYAPPPVYAAPPPVVYAPPPAYYRPYPY